MDNKDKAKERFVASGEGVTVTRPKEAVNYVLIDDEDNGDHS